VRKKATDHQILKEQWQMSTCFWSVAISLFGAYSSCYAVCVRSISDKKLHSAISYETKTSDWSKFFSLRRAFFTSACFSLLRKVYDER